MVVEGTREAGLKRSLSSECAGVVWVDGWVACLHADGDK